MGIMHDNIAKKCLKSSVIPTGSLITWLWILSRDYPFIKSGPFEGNLNRNKIDGMANDHLSTVAILKIYTNIAKYCL